MPFLKPWRAFTPIGTPSTVDVTRGRSLWAQAFPQLGKIWKHTSD